jgi:hypothetical protein
MRTVTGGNVGREAIETVSSGNVKGRQTQALTGRNVGRVAIQTASSGNV